MFTSVNLPGVDELIADNMKLDGYFFMCMCNVPGICCDECSLQNLWASFVMSWTAGNSLWSNFNVAFLHSLLFLSTSMRMWTQSMDFKHRINSSTQVFLQYICNWCEDATSCASPHWRLDR